MDISAHRIAVLLAVHRAGGVVAAADLLRLSPSAVSQQIRLLENEAGVRVLDRTPAGAILTDSGRVLAEAAERIESELTTARRELALIDGDTPTGTVRIGTFATAIRALLLPLLRTLEESLPGIELVIEESEERAALGRLRQGTLDLVLLERDSHTLPAPPRAMNDVPLLDESWLVVVPPEKYPAALTAAPHLDILTVPAADGRISLPAALTLLAERGIGELLVEAGATLCGAFLQSDLADEIVLYQASKILGGNARSLFDLPENPAALQQPASWQTRSVTILDGGDLKQVLRKKEAV